MTALIDCSEEERRKSLVRARQRKYRATAKGQAKQRAYRRRPDVKAKARAYSARPEVKERQRALEQRPEQREKQRAYSRRPDVQERRIPIAKKYRNRPEVKARRSERVRARMLRDKYGLTEQQYALMLEMQGGVCVICGRPPKQQRLAVEHDHATNRVRGLACWHCNKYKIGTNTAESARRVLAYLESDFDGRKIAA